MERKRHLDDDVESSISKKQKIDVVDMAKKRAEIMAKVAAMGLAKPATTSEKPGPTNLPAKPTTSSSSTPLLPDPSELARRVAEARRRVAEATAKAEISSNPYIPAPNQGKKKVQPEVTVPQGTGLKMKAHPLLLETAPTATSTSKKDRYKPMAPKFASTKANARLAAPTPGPSAEPAKINPYTSRVAPQEGFDGAPKERIGRTFRFNQKGKYVAKANEMRHQAQIEALRQRVALSAQKAGLGTEFDVVEKVFRREPPPEAEWWDRSLLPNKSYDDVDDGIETLYIRNDDSPITLLIQHPIPLPPPGEKNKPAPKPLKLTTKEQKKLRKQRRAAELQDHQDRVRMGLIPPDAPKVRMANMVRVLTNDAVTDPTKLEARIRREVQMRKTKHEKDNLERKLTAEQRREKLEEKREQDEKKGLKGALFRIKTLVDPSHQFKVSKTALQDGLTGICIINPNVCLVYVEGGGKGIKHYTKLLERRVDWKQPARHRDRQEEEEDDNDEKGEEKPVKRALNETVEESALADNRCDLIWEGVVAEHVFHNFKTVRAPTDNLAREHLGLKLASWWDTAKSWKPADEEYE